MTIPPEAGYILSADDPATPSRPTVLHLQETHADPDVQRRLIAILEQLIAQHRVQLILVEGGQGDVSLSYLRTYASPERRQQVAETYLASGVFSAEEYLDLASDHPLTLWGVEDRELYRRHVEALLSTQPLRVSLAETLAAVRQQVERLKPVVLSAPLNELLAMRQAFDEERLGLEGYVGFLAELATRHHVPIDESHLARFVELQALESRLALEEVRQEQQALIDRLTLIVRAEEMEALRAAAQQVNAGRYSRADFSAQLRQVMVSAHVAPETFPRLAQYLDYTIERDRLDAARLSEELRAFHQRMSRALAATPEARHLLALAEELALAEAFVEFRVTPEDEAAFRACCAGGVAERWRATLTPLLTAHGLTTAALGALQQLDDALPTLTWFYALAMMRDEAMVARILRKLEETGERLAVLITGGFHAPRIHQLLKARGLGVVAIVPKVDTPTDERLYHAVVRYKRGEGTLDEVLTVANQSVVRRP